MLISKHIRFRRILRSTWKISTIILLVCIASYLFNQYILAKYFDFPAIVDAILGTALAFFIGFNNNQAYDRWWEARKIWGSIVNDSRSWVRQLTNYPVAKNENDQKELVGIVKRMVHRHIAFLYALKTALRGDEKKDFSKYLSEEEFEEVTQKTNVQNAILFNQSKDLKYLYKRNWVDGFGFLQLNNLLVAFTNQMGMSERIKGTVFPPIYNHYTRLFIWILIVSSTFVIGDLVGPWSIIFGFLLGYIFIVTQMLGQKLVNPFDQIDTGISLDQITRTIEN